jgi:predicted hydrocarbon binding protein
MARVKGATIVDSVRFLRRHKKEAREVLSPALHHYLNERVLSASWYPEEDLVPLVRAIARITGEREQAFLERAGRLAARAHAQGVYRHLAGGDRESLARRALVLWSSQHDTGAMEMEVETSGKVRVALRGFGLPSREFCIINGGYIAATFEISGCAGVRVEKQSCCVDGAPACTWLVSWKGRA